MFWCDSVGIQLSCCVHYIVPAVVVGLTPTTAMLKDLEVKAAVQHNEMTSYPIISDLMPVDDDHVSSLSDVPPPQQLKPDCNVELERSGVVAPPLTARNAQNPTVERNTHRGSSEELAIKGNTLVPRSAADDTVADVTVTVSQPDTSQSRRLSALRPDQLHRISYVQNVVDNAPTTGPTTAAAPKRQNVDTQARRPYELDCDDELDKAGGACPVLADDGVDASHNTAAAAAGDNLGYESSTSPCYEAAAAPTSCII